MPSARVSSSRVLRSNRRSDGFPWPVPRAARPRRDPADVVNLPFGPGGQVGDQPGFEGQGDDPSGDPLQVDRPRACRSSPRPSCPRPWLLAPRACFSSAFGSSFLCLGPSCSFRLLGAFLVALLEQRVGRRLLERDQVGRERHGHVGERLVEPVLDRAGIGRGEEVEVLAAGVEDRPARLGEAIGERERFVLVERVEPDRSGSPPCWSGCRRATSSRATSSRLKVLIGL